jgi:hypothetical protein
VVLEEQPQQDPTVRGPGRVVAEDLRCGAVPGEDPGEGLGAVRGDVDMVDELLLQGGVCSGAHCARRPRMAREGEQVATIWVRQSQRVGEGGDHAPGGVDQPSLLQARVPDDADPGPFGDVVASQSWRAAASRADLVATGCVAVIAVDSRALPR